MALKRFVIVLILANFANSTPLEPSPRSDSEYRLPNDTVEAISYDIELRMATDVFTTNEFQGTVSLKFKSLKSTTEIKLHANKLNISSVGLTTASGGAISLSTTDFSSLEDTDILTLTTEISLEANAEYTLKFEYVAQLRTDEMYGFYKSWYLDENNEKRYLGTTQFQPTHARKVFPCFDEPIYKATFNIKIKHPREYQAVGNNDILETTDITENGEQFTMTAFETTPKMSTYLVAFVVSDFTCDQSNEAIEEGVPHIVCSRKEEASNRQVALEAGPKLVHVLENFTNIKYSASGLTKMHEFAIPDFSAGAMENWGLLTYRETGLLYDPEETSNSYLQSIKNVIAHEVAHMWFGNLITCHWWKDTFLNEGFARYFQYHATAELEPSWELDKQFVTAQIHSMMLSDASTSSAALSADAFTPTQVSQRFSSVSYNKGATILRWLTYILGADNFKTGIQTYLADNTFRNTYPENLWSALQSATPEGALPSGSTLADIIEDWIVEAGFPVLNVKLEGHNVVITQERFLTSGTSDTKWNIPITYTTSYDTDKFLDTSTKVWFKKDDANVTIEHALHSEDEWIVLNNQQIGYYRVNYDTDLWNRIKNALNSPGFGGIHPINRAQLVDDFYNFAKVGLVSYSQVFDFYQFLKKDNSYYPWYSAITAFSNMLQRTDNARIRNELSVFILDLIEILYNTHPFNEPKNDNQIYTFNRVQAATWACRLGLPDCIDNALAAFQQYRNDPSQKPDKNLKAVIYCNGLRHSNSSTIEENWNFLWGEYGKTKLASEKVTLISALGCAKDETILNRYLEKSIDADSGIRQQDALSVFSAVYSQNPEGIDIALQFLIDNYLKISNYYGSMNSLNSLFTGLAGRFTNQAQIDKLENFLNTTNDLGETEKSIQSALSTAKVNLAWTETFEKELSGYFSLSTADSVKAGVTTLAATLVILIYNIL